MVPSPTSASPANSMKSFKSSITEIATSEPINLIFKPLKSIVPIQCGRSLDSRAMSMRETKFSYPAKMTIRIRFASKVKSRSASKESVNSLALISAVFSARCQNSITKRYARRTSAPTSPRYNGASKKRLRKRITSTTCEIWLMARF